MKRLVLMAAATLLMVPPLAAQDSAAVRILRQQALTVRFDNGKLSGAGADALAADLALSQFFLIGESHGFAELPQLTSALFEMGRTIGYRHLAVEVGPASATHIQSLAARPLPDSAFARFHDRFPFALSFYMWAEEQRMAQQVVASLPHSPDVLWGLDQEVMFARHSSFATSPTRPTLPVANGPTKSLTTPILSIG